MVRRGSDVWLIGDCVKPLEKIVLAVSILRGLRVLGGQPDKGHHDGVIPIIIYMFVDE